MQIILLLIKKRLPDSEAFWHQLCYGDCKMLMCQLHHPFHQSAGEKHCPTRTAFQEKAPQHPTGRKSLLLFHVFASVTREMGSSALT